ncbi:hypothetical protein AGOR_G00017160 [Albula goreensis]|uniref:Uncharacterized protein n=1 Tax=Albula goreensis TaxID=1534307 RepID=A0A8T3E022_9TELE|nr:hypothetical protein AGOR_G00017160 [Albula goreensis]
MGRKTAAGEDRGLGCEQKGAVGRHQEDPWQVVVLKGCDGPVEVGGGTLGTGPAHIICTVLPRAAPAVLHQIRLNGRGYPMDQSAWRCSPHGWQMRLELWREAVQDSPRGICLF